jgi:hypothetical protein
MAKLKIPAGLDELTPEWLTHALRQTGTITDATVESFELKAIGEGAGFRGQLAQVALRYEGSDAGAPRSLVAKFPSDVPENRDGGNLFHFYERETRFYQEIADEVELRTPRCYYSAMDVEADEYVLLLEDLAPARVGDQVAGCSPDEAELAIRHLAKFHATWWESPRLAEIDWMPFASDPTQMQAVEDSYRGTWDSFLERFGDRLQASMVRTGERLADNIAGIMAYTAEPPRTIMHGDYRLDNLFFATPEGGDPLAVIDWQISFRGRGVFDVAYFMSGSLHPKERKAKEMGILRSYHSILTENGVRDYSFDQCLHDYRLSTLFCLVYPVIGGGSLDMGNERGVALWNGWLDRNVAAIVDLDAGELMAK